MTIEILLFDGFDDLDAFGPFEVLRTAGLDTRFVTAEPADTVTSSGGARVIPHGVLGDPDLLIVPGGGWNDRSGPGAYAEAQRGVIPAKLREREGRIASVCTGAMLLAAAGLLTGRRAITHHSAIEDLREAGADVVEGARYVDEGDILTSAGVSAGIDMALHLVGDQAATVAREIEWDEARPAGSLR
ncbi:DJ-1/PfpI family protein [Solirubrobacter sp. CPCC 204708]|uniref:DJ-1/PfpI family protein n=1 Tax=Solirubrobacter deserti TaxID=2282478 RepID=A0ABT4RS97_9ACTN|nr:DJ-1/PfpI family protein [Solirubrobacter deserti]MBE2315116.1 DJ-1/PfpI family protein [Solirubrobacter deserti]MDA0141362.1 DJ-1/PfpI family protein [Solirubrobacter deserti]